MNNKPKRGEYAFITLKKFGFAFFPCVIFSLIAFLGISFAMPAAPDFFEIIQPDGNIIKAKQVGDEWNNRTETGKGFTIKKAKDGFWYYLKSFQELKPVFSDTTAHNPPPPGLQKHLHPQRQFLRNMPLPAVGSENLSGLDSSFSASTFISSATGTFSGSVLFILAEFSNQKGTYPEESFAFFLSGMIKDYFSKASYGKATLSPAAETFGTANNGVVGWLDLGYKHPDTGDTIDRRNSILTRNAILAADQFVDFASYDRNSDGFIDADELAIVVIVAGWEQSYRGLYSPSVWGHKWSIAAQDGIPLVDGVYVGAYNSGAGGYAQFGEIHQSNTFDGHQASMGIMVHELGHLIFRLPDLYDTDYSSSGIGAFGLMSGGSWGQAADDLYAGQTPVLPCAWSRFNLMWADAVSDTEYFEVTAAGSVTASSTNSVFRATTVDPGQYFLVENRQPVGYDRGLERYLGENFSGGLSIWHIDEAMLTNTNDFHRKVDLEEADSTVMGTDHGESSDLWSLEGGYVFNDSSDPDSRLYDGSSSDVCFNIISTDSAGIISVRSGPDCDSFISDVDNDGVPDLSDYCPDTPELEEVDITGCSYSQRDDDGDGFSNGVEEIAGSDPDNSRSLPVATSLSLKKGYNQVSFPAEAKGYGDLQTLMESLGGSVVIEKIMIFDHVNQVFSEAGYNGEGSFYGDNIILSAGSDLSGLIIYAKQDVGLLFTSHFCYEWGLKTGPNLVGSGCISDGLTAYGLLNAIGFANAASIQRFDHETGGFETAVFDQAGDKSGPAFPIIQGEGYFVYMKQDVVVF